MASLDIDYEFLQGSALKMLAEQVGCRALAIGYTVEFWELAKEYWVKDKSLIPLKVFNKMKLPKCILDPELGIAEVKDDMIYAKGSEDRFEWILRRRESARKGGIKSGKMRQLNKINNLDCEAKPKQTEPPNPNPNPNSKEERINTVNEIEISQPKEKSKTVETWEAYKSAFKEKYKVDPVRNAKVNSQIKQFVERVGQDDAPEVIAFYVHHPNQYYKNRCHQLGIALADCEKLRTEWASGRIINSNKANTKTERNAELYEELIGEENEPRRIKEV